MKNRLLQHSTSIVSCLSRYENVRQALPVIVLNGCEGKCVRVGAAERLMPVLLRKEKVENTIPILLRYYATNSSYLQKHQQRNDTLHIQLQHYAKCGGKWVLEKYTGRLQLAIADVWRGGLIREWCCKFYTQQSTRIKYEKETGIKLHRETGGRTRGILPIQYLGSSS